ncbi:MAG: hypothetical protein GWN16_06105, partial [Calditrichae bacterium]|nr:hypothetical protein [Calditrichia bacterium]
YGALRDELVKLLDHYRAYKKAEQTGLLDDSMFVKARNWEKRAAMLR